MVGVLKLVVCVTGVVLCGFSAWGCDIDIRNFKVIDLTNREKGGLVIVW